jgi:hypothetical protein
MSLFVACVLVLIAIFTVYLMLYPELSNVRQRCNKVEIGMTRSQSENILGDLLSKDQDMINMDQKQIYIIKDGIDCRVMFDDAGKVTDVSTSVDSF